MKTCNSSNQWVRWMATVGCVLTVSAGAHGGGQPEAGLATQVNSPDGYAGHVGSVYGPTDVAITLQPKKAFFKDGVGDWVEIQSEVIDNEIILYAGGVNVMLELQVNDWSGPDGTTRLHAFEATLDTAGYSNGLGGALTETLVPCASDEDCVAALPGFCSILGQPCTASDQCALYSLEFCSGSTCEEAPSRLAGFCSPAYTVKYRQDFAFQQFPHEFWPTGGVNLATPEYSYRWVNPVWSDAFADIDTTKKNGKAYMGTLWFEVPDNAKGTYTIGLHPPPATVLIDQDDQIIPMVGLVPAKITILDCPGTDCQPNGIPDDCEIERGLTEDCNGNAVPDECEVGTGATADCNKNRIPDECDIAAGRARDCNDNAVPDICDLASGAATDCNRNRILDECDIDTGARADCNENRIPDECDIADGTSQDCNGNDVPDDCEPDCNGNGVADDCEEDSDGDGIIDACDGCPDDPNMTSPGLCGCGLSDVDSDLDAVPDCVDQCPGMDDRIDQDADGTPDCLDPIPTLSAWGLITLALLLLAGGKIYFGRRRAATL